MCAKKKPIPSYWVQVYEIVQLIPPGRVTTYGAIANFLALGSARMVGWALNQCHTMEAFIPAHRVVNRKGELTGRNQFPTPTAMEEALLAEGIVVIDGTTIKNFQEVLWLPEEHL